MFSAVVLNDLHDESDFAARSEFNRPTPALPGAAVVTLSWQINRQQQQRRQQHPHINMTARPLSYRARVPPAGRASRADSARSLFAFLSRNVQEINTLPFVHGADQRAVSKVSEAVAQSIKPLNAADPPPVRGRDAEIWLKRGKLVSAGVKSLSNDANRRMNFVSLHLHFLLISRSALQNLSLPVTVSRSFHNGGESTFGEMIRKKEESTKTNVTFLFRPSSVLPAAPSS